MLPPKPPDNSINGPQPRLDQRTKEMEMVLQTLFATTSSDASVPAPNFGSAGMVIDSEAGKEVPKGL